MINQKGFGLISTIIVLAIVAAAGWLVFTRMTNVTADEKPDQAIDRAKDNVDQASEASKKAKDAIEETTEILDEINDNQ